jgi:Mg/Co/Ni transporter MgtE
MSDHSALTVAFLHEAPRAAAQELQRLRLAEAAALVESVPTRIGIPVLTSMIPWHCARLLEALTAAKAGGVLRQLSFADSVSLMRLVNVERRESILDALPTRFARRLRGALTYAENQVGAWTDPEVPTLSLTDTVGDALRVLQASEPASHVFVESEGHEKFVGTISVMEILRGSESAELGRLAVESCAPVSNRDALSSLAFDARWDDYLHLPVVGRRGNLLGGLSRKTLRQALHPQHRPVAASRRTPAAVLLRALGTTSIALLRVIFSGSSSDAAGQAQGAANDR